MIYQTAVLPLSPRQFLAAKLSLWRASSMEDYLQIFPLPFYSRFCSKFMLRHIQSIYQNLGQMTRTLDTQFLIKLAPALEGFLLELSAWDTKKAVFSCAPVEYKAGQFLSGHSAPVCNFNNVRWEDKKKVTTECMPHIWPIFSLKKLRLKVSSTF